MILYVNGDSHTAAAEAVNLHAFAEDDSQYFYMGRAPHPDNIKVSWGRKLANAVKAQFVCGAESASSNTRILRTTYDWINDLTPQQRNEALVIIQWSTWEREEWLINGTYYQVNGSGIDIVPEDWVTRYKEWIVGLDYYKKTLEAHEQIWELHTHLKELGIKHVFFNGNNDFTKVPDHLRKDWDDAYIGPYDPELTFHYVISQECETVSPDSWHYGADGHSVWFKFILSYLIDKKFI